MSNFILTAILIMVVAITSLVFYNGRPSYLAKFMLVALVVASAAGISLSFESYKGWPSQEKIAQGRLKGVEIVSPGVNTNGHIYVWVYPNTAALSAAWYGSLIYLYPDVAPRNFVLPYSKRSAKKFSDAKKALDNGDIVDIDAKGNNGGASGGVKGVSGDQDKKGSGKLAQEDTSSGAQGDTVTGDDDDYNLKITPADSILSKP